MALTAQTMLRRAADLELILGHGGTVEIRRSGQKVLSGDGQLLSVLGVFEPPRTLEGALQQLKAMAASARHWASFAEMIRRLVAAGVLVPVGGEEPITLAGGSVFDRAAVHISMLNDRVRTEAFLAAIRATVRPGDVVVDIGTGTGVLAVAAALAGARRVYAIEAGAMARVAREVVKSNGVADRVTVIEGWSHSVTLPERADVLVSETIANAAFEENIIGIVRDATDRLLKPEARIVPREVRLQGLPVQLGEGWLERLVFRSGRTRLWQDWYGVDFSALPGLPLSPEAMPRVKLNKAGAWTALGKVVPLARAEFGPESGGEFDSESRWRADQSGEVNAVVLFFDLETAPGIHLSTDPRLPGERAARSWANPVWLVPPRAVEAGAELRVAYSWSPEHAGRLSLEPAG